MFFFSLPILFSDIQTVSPAELLLIALAVTFILTITAPVTSDDEGLRLSYDNYFLASWVGGVPLSSVFWPFFLLLNLSLLSADLLAKAGKISVSSWDDIHFILILPIVWWSISIWRCSSNSNNRLWPGLSRTATLAVVAEYALKLLIRVDYPRIFFNCEEILLDYGSCF